MTASEQLHIIKQAYELKQASIAASLGRIVMPDRPPLPGTRQMMSNLGPGLDTESTSKINLPGTTF